MPTPSTATPVGVDPSCSLNEAAARLGVHYMTAYRYVRAGLLDAVQEAGVWRVTPEAIESFNANRGGPGRDAGRRARGRTTSPPKMARRRAGALADRMIAGDERGAWAVVESALASGTSLEDAYLTLLCRALSIVGDRWESRSIGVGEEHRASVVAMRLIGRLGALCGRPGRTRGTVVLAAAPGDRHGMPTAIVADVLRLRGFGAVDLGADVPPAELAAAASTVDRLVGVGVCATTTPDTQAMRLLERMVGSVRQEVDRPVLLGGAAITSPAWATEIGAEPGGSEARDALDFFDRLAPAGARADTGH